MFRHTILIVSSLTLMLSGALPLSATLAESSTGIRLGNTDFGGESRSRSSTFSNTQDAQSSRDGGSYHHGYHRSDHDSSSFSTGNDRDPSVQLGTEDKSHDRHQREHHYPDRHDNYNGSYGIKGHRSFGLGTYYGGHRRHHVPSYPANYYHGGSGITFYYAPDTVDEYDYQDSTTVITGYQDKPAEKQYSIDPWAALSDYQIRTARHAFEAQIQQQPYDALPRVGYALSTALSGDIDGGAFAMEDALLSDTSGLRYFSADQDLQLVIEELLLSYDGEPLMTAALHYLNSDYQAAERAVQVAENYCQQCTAVDNLSGLIAARL